MAKFSLFKVKSLDEGQVVPTQSQDSDGSEWLEEGYEGQLSVDVYQTTDDVYIKSTIAGVKADDLDISINNDLVTIRGARHQEDKVDDNNYFYRECYWGGFSRSIVLPVEVKAEAAAATLKNGVLTLRLPKAEKDKVVNVGVEEIDE